MLYWFFNMFMWCSVGNNLVYMKHDTNATPQEELVIIVQDNVNFDNVILYEFIIIELFMFFLVVAHREGEEKAQHLNFL
ncbi:hypothetical protein ACJX0J_028777, partial [Zea mays]